jgi:hypothetical protein
MMDWPSAVAFSSMCLSGAWVVTVMFGRSSVLRPEPAPFKFDPADRGVSSIDIVDPTSRESR